MGAASSVCVSVYNVPLFCSAGQKWGKGRQPRFQAVQRMMTGALFCINPKIPVCWCQSQHYVLLFSHLLCRFRFKMCWGYIGLLKPISADFFLFFFFLENNKRFLRDGRNKMISSDRIQRSSYQLTHPGGCCSSLVRQSVSRLKFGLGNLSQHDVAIQLPTNLNPSR